MSGLGRGSNDLKALCEVRGPTAKAAARMLVSGLEPFRQFRWLADVKRTQTANRYVESARPLCPDIEQMLADMGIGADPVPALVGAADVFKRLATTHTVAGGITSQAFAA